MDKKFIETIDISDYEILTDSGFEDIVSLHKTIPYEVYELKTENHNLKCADTHILFNDKYEEVYVRDLKIGDLIPTEKGLEEVKSIEFLGYKENMYDFELTNSINHRYFTNGILSHNTELALALAKYYFEDEDALIEVDMGEYTEKISISRLTGAAPGYIGYEEGGELTNKVKIKPYSVVLLDEIEKAHPDVWNLFLKPWEKGFLTDSQGYKVDFRNVIFILTSNIGTDKLAKFGKGIGYTKSSVMETIEIESVLSKAVEKEVKAELLNRIDDIIIFNMLDKDALYKIIDINLKGLKKRMSQYFNFELDDSVRDLLIKEGTNEKFGARPLRRSITKLVENTLVDVILKGVPKNSTVSATVVEGKIEYTISDIIENLN